MKGRDQPLDLVGLHAGTGVGDREPQPRGRRAGVAVDADGDVHLPRSVNFSALPTRFMTTSRSRTRSPTRTPSSLLLERQVEAFAPGHGEQGGDHLGGDFRGPERALGQRDRGGLGLGQVEHVVEQHEEGLTRAAGQRDELGLPGLSCSSPSASSMPRTPLSGVRISWLAAARNAVLARVAASAWSLAASSSRASRPCSNSATACAARSSSAPS